MSNDLRGFRAMAPEVGKPTRFPTILVITHRHRNEITNSSSIGLCICSCAKGLTSNVSGAVGQAIRGNRAVPLCTLADGTCRPPIEAGVFCSANRSSPMSPQGVCNDSFCFLLPIFYTTHIGRELSVH